MKRLTIILLMLAVSVCSWAHDIEAENADGMTIY